MNGPLIKKKLRELTATIVNQILTQPAFTLTVTP
jgi:hypothetical protein